MSLQSKEVRASRKPHGARIGIAVFAIPRQIAGMNLQLDDLAVFVRVVELGTLSAAAREREVPVSQVTRALVRLEQICAARLLHRSTHGLSLTAEGSAFLAHARQMLDTRAALQSELTGNTGGPAGWVRVSVSPIVAQAILAPSLNGLYERHPQLHLDFAADDRMADMARDGIDIAIRTGTPNADTLVAREIGTLTRGLYAAPAYLARHGTPRDVDELRRHRLIGNNANPALNRWRMGAGKQEFLVDAHTRTDNTGVVLALALNGVGIARVIDLVAVPLVQAGALVPVLPEVFSTPPFPVYAVMLQERHRLPKLRACIDYWTQWMSQQARTLQNAGNGQRMSKRG